MPGRVAVSAQRLSWRVRDESSRLIEAEAGDRGAQDPVAEDRAAAAFGRGAGDDHQRDQVVLLRMRRARAGSVLPIREQRVARCGLGFDGIDEPGIEVCGAPGRRP